MGTDRETTEEGVAVTSEEIHIHLLAVDSGVATEEMNSRGTLDIKEEKATAEE